MLRVNPKRILIWSHNRRWVCDSKEVQDEDYNLLAKCDSCSCLYDVKACVYDRTLIQYMTFNRRRWFCPTCLDKITNH